MLTGGFVSFITGILMKEYFGLSDTIIFAMCGIFGYGGITIFNFIIDAVKEKLMAKSQGETDVSNKESL